MLIFQFTLPREERRQVQAQPLTLQNFNPRSHERSDHITQSFVFRFFNFNPRSHERSDETYKTLYISDLISIHAPTRGATLLKLAISISLIFQSTLPREERHIAFRCFPFTYYFNPRSHERSDNVYLNDNHAFIISIHAPTRGATIQYAKAPYQPGISIHAPTRGATSLSSAIYYVLRFQSTLPREERHTSFAYSKLGSVNFNPRSHERSDGCSGGVPDD